jgi:hypothetical protein
MDTPRKDGGQEADQQEYDSGVIARFITAVVAGPAWLWHRLTGAGKRTEDGKA